MRQPEGQNSSQIRARPDDASGGDRKDNRSVAKNGAFEGDQGGRGGGRRGGQAGGRRGELGTVACNRRAGRHMYALSRLSTQPLEPDGRGAAHGVADERSPRYIRVQDPSD